MAAEIEYIEPLEMTQGETVQWKKQLKDYPANDANAPAGAGWTLKYSFRGPGPGLDISATPDANGTDYDVTLSMVQTAEFVPANNAWLNGKAVWNWSSYVVSNDDPSTERFNIAQGTLTVYQDLSAVAANTTVDLRSHVKKVLDALEATLEGKATKDQMSYSIAGRTLSRMQPKELIDWRDHYHALYVEERRLEKIRRGEGKSSGQSVRVRFTRPGHPGRIYPGSKPF